MRSGPAPDPNALKRDRDGKQWAKLPAGGRTGAPPPWPLHPDPAVTGTIEHLRERAELLRDRWASAADDKQAALLAAELDGIELRLSVVLAEEEARERAEASMWEELWHSPQAVVWEADNATSTVALYVRSYLEATRPGATAGMRSVVKQLSEALLLTPMSLYAGRYVIAPEAEEVREPAAATAGGGGVKQAAPTGVRGRLAVVRPAEEEGDAE